MKWCPPPVTGDNLRSIVRDAPQGAEIVVPPGEFEGPFIVDRPLRLTGRGDRPEATTLWARRGPVVIVRSAGVSLDNLSVELTLPEARQNDASLWYRTGCQPNTQDARMRGRMEQMGASQSGGWQLPDLIDLGDLRAKHPVTLPMVIQVPGPARLHGELTDLHVQPSRLPNGGEWLIRVGIPGERLHKDTMLAGHLVIESGGETRIVWIIGRVLEDEFKAWVKDTIILMGESGRKFGLASGTLLGAEQFKGEPGADRLAEKQAYILKDPTGVWSIIQPLTVSEPTRVDGKVLGVGKRQLLKGGEVIEVGKLKLTVEAKKTDLPIKVDGTVDFGKLSRRATAATPTIKLETNYKRRKWQGTLRSTVPWIQVPNPDVVCPAGQTERVTVQLGSGLSSLPKQVINYSGALVLEGRRVTCFISARLDVDVEEALEVEPTAVDFGRVSDPAAVAPQRIRLRNVGTVDWQGTVQIAVPWLETGKKSLQCAAGAEATLELSLTDQVTALPEGPSETTEALKIVGQGLRATVAARIDYDKPKVQLDLEPRVLDWGEVLDWRAARPQTVRVRNTGTKDWQGAVEGKAPWLAITPTTLRCPAQGQATFRVRLSDQFVGLPLGEQKVPAAVCVKGEGLSLPVLARVVVRAPEIELDTTRIDLVYENSSALPHQTVHLKNRGGQTWRGTVKSIRWLEVSPSDITCPAGSEASLDITLSSEASRIFRRPRTIRVDNAIQIEGPGRPLLIGVSLTVKPPPRKPQPIQPRPTQDDKESKTSLPEPRSPELVVDFGQVWDWSKPLPEEHLHLTNSQSQVMKGTVRSTLPWLEITPTSFTCPPGQKAMLTARLTERASRLRIKEYDVPNGVVIECGGKEFRVRARMEVVKAPSLGEERKPPRVVPPDPLPDAALDFGTVSDWSGPLPKREIPITNSQSQAMKGTARSTVPWLEITPARFSCPPGGEEVLTAKVVKPTVRMRPRTYDAPRALTIESGGEKHRIAARLKVVKVSPPSSSQRDEKEGEEPPRVVLPDPLPDAALDFGTVSDWSGPLPKREIPITNSQSQAMKGTARSTVPWLELTPARFSCPPGEELVLTVRVVKPTVRMRPRTYDAPNALTIESGGEKHRIAARLKVVKVSPATPFQDSKREREEPSPGPPPTDPLAGLTLDFGTVSDWSEPLPEREVRLTNSQPQVMEGTVRSSLPWLEIAPTTFSCPPGEDLVLTATLTEAAKRLRSKEYAVPDGAMIVIGGNECEVGIRLEVDTGDRLMGIRTILPARELETSEPVGVVMDESAISQEAETGTPVQVALSVLTVKPRSIDMSTVVGQSGSLPAQEITLINGLEIDWTGEARSTVPWLKVTPSEVTCPSGKTVALKTELTEHVSRLRPRTYSAKDAVTIEGAGHRVLVKASVTVKKK